MTVVVDERIAERRRRIKANERRRRLRRTIITGLVLLLLVAAVLVERSDLVALEEVRVEGTTRLDPTAVREAAALELGTSTLRLRLGAAEERVEQLPLVLRAEARRIDPLTVAISVVEREPFLVARSGTDAVLIDRRGKVIATGAEADLVAVQASAPLPAPGEHVRDHAWLDAVFRVATELPGPLRTRVARYDVDGEGDVLLHLDGGVRVRFGGANRLEEKARALGAVLEDVAQTPVELIDVRAPSSPVVRR